MRLQDAMDFDSPITITHKDGATLIGESDVYAPTLMDEELDDSRWDLWSHGYTGQHGYNGPIMHNSEYIGGRMELDLLAEQGTYVVLAAYWTDDDGNIDIEGWAIARLRD